MTLGWGVNRFAKINDLRCEGQFGRANGIMSGCHELTCAPSQPQLKGTVG